MYFLVKRIVCQKYLDTYCFPLKIRTPLRLYFKFKCAKNNFVFQTI